MIVARTHVVTAYMLNIFGHAKKHRRTALLHGPDGLFSIISTKRPVVLGEEIARTYCTGVLCTALARARVHVRAHTPVSRYYVPTIPVGTESPYEDRRVVVKVAGVVDGLKITICFRLPGSRYGWKKARFDRDC